MDEQFFLYDEQQKQNQLNMPPQEADHYYQYDPNLKKMTDLTSKDYQTRHDVNAALADTEEEKRKAGMDYFAGIRSKTTAVLPVYLEMQVEVGETYENKLTDEERKRLAEKSGTELWKKHDNAVRITEAQTKVSADILKRKNAVAKELNMSPGNLSSIAAFFGKSKSENVNLANIWLRRHRDPQSLLEALLNPLLKLSFSDLDLTTDRNIAKNAPRMEELSARYDALINILLDHRETYDRLDDRSRKRVEKKIGEINGLLNYYRLMKSVITDPYYMTHENRELSRKMDKKDTPQQKRMLRQIWMARGGLSVLTEYGTKQLDEKLEALCGRLSTQVVTEEQLKLQKELAEREDEIEKKGFSNRLSKLEKQGKHEAFDAGASGSIFTRARNSVKAIELPDRVEKAFSSVSNILDQLQFVESLTLEKSMSKNSYYLDHNYRDIAVMDQVENLGAPLKDMKDAILSIANMTKGGMMKSRQITGDDLKEAQAKYQEALQRYRDGIARMKALDKEKLMPKPAQEMADFVAASEKTRAKFVKGGEEFSEEQKKQVCEKLKSMTLKLAENEYSDYYIYENAKEIIELMLEKKRVLGGQDADEYENYNYLGYLAEYLYATKRRQDIAHAKTQANLTKEEIAALDQEYTVLEPVVGKKNEPMLNSARRVQMRARLQAEKDRHDLADLKATASHYLFQEEWAKNSKRVQPGIFARMGSGFFSGVTRFLGWIFSKPKTVQHGAVLYEESKRKLDQLPQGIETFGNQGTNQTITHGDGIYAPPVELNKYYKDSMKLTLAADYNNILQAAGNAAYPPCIRDAMDALSSYCKVRAVVNGDTFEMEHAFLDQFRKSVEEMASDVKAIDAYPDLCSRILTANNHLIALSNGNLSEKMSKAEYEAAKDLKAVYVRDTYTGDMKESNMRYLPLFPHEPNLNDVKQGTIGDCYLVAAVQNVLIEDPGAIRDMFHDLGNGEVLVRFYATFDEVENAAGTKEYRRVDDTEKMRSLKMKPVYVKVKKQYTAGEAHASDCMWMQLLEVAYAAAGFSRGASEVNEDGELVNLNRELTNGDPEAALMHLTGKKQTAVKPADIPDLDMKQTEIEKSSGWFVQMHSLLVGVDLHLRQLIYNQLIDQKRKMLKQLKQSNVDVTLATEETMIRDAVKKAIKICAETKRDWRKDLDTLVTQGRLEEKEKNELVKLLENHYIYKEEDVDSITNTILKNLESPGNTTTINHTQFYPLSSVCEKIRKVVNDNPKLKEGEAPASVYKKIKEIIDEKHERRGPLNKPTEVEQKAFKLSVKNFMTVNPENRYTQRELGVLNLVRRQTAKGRGVLFADDGHCRTALDAKLHNGKWFILVRDPFNTYRNEYRTENNQLKTKSYGLRTTVFSEHFDVRKLTPDLKQGFLGTSWYELKDIAKVMKNFVHTADEEED